MYSAIGSFMTIVVDAVGSSLPTISVACILLTTISVYRISLSTVSAVVLLVLRRFRSFLFQQSNSRSLTRLQLVLSYFFICSRSSLNTSTFIQSYQSSSSVSLMSKYKPLLLVVRKFEIRCPFLCGVTCGSMRLEWTCCNSQIGMKAMVRGPSVIVTTISAIRTLRHGSSTGCTVVQVAGLCRNASFPKLIALSFAVMKSMSMRRICCRFCIVLSGSRYSKLICRLSFCVFGVATSIVPSVQAIGSVIGTSHFVFLIMPRE